MPNKEAWIEELTGNSSIHKASDSQSVEAISTGNQFVDRIFGNVGGIPKSRITEIYGSESTGKTSLALCLIAQAQKQGGIAAYIDVDQTFNSLQASGCGVDTSQLLYSSLTGAREIIRVTLQLIRSNALSIVVLDSLPSIVSGDHTLAQELAQNLKIFNAEIQKTNTALVLINQIRSRVTGEETPGGNSLKSLASVRLKMTHEDEIFHQNRADWSSHETYV